MWQALRENPRAVTYAVLMHVGLLLLLVFSLDWTPKVVKPGTNKPIQAELVDMTKVREMEAQKKAEQQRIADQKRKQEQEKQRQAEAERKKKAEQEAKRKAEAKAEAVRQREAEQALQAQLAEEAAQARAQSALSEFIPYIQEKVQNNWLRPLGSPPGLSCVIQVTLIPGGEVVGTRVVRSSGNQLFDESVERAVQKASPLPLPDDPALFKYFREINFKFVPD